MQVSFDFLESNTPTSFSLPPISANKLSQRQQGNRMDLSETLNEKDEAM